MEIYLVRHTSVDVAPGICYGRSDVNVRNSFEEEAHKTKLQLKDIQFDKVFTSPLTRAIKLASYCGYSKAEIDYRLIEYNFGDWELESYDRLYKEDDFFRLWCKDYIHQKSPNGESLMDQVTRVNGFLSMVKNNGYHRICAFCHGGVLAIGRSICNGISLVDSFSDIPPYGSVLRLIYN